jgi:protoheme IX farnesyltransferase
MKNISHYYHLAKPGMVYGNLISILAAFFLASKEYGFHITALIFVILGMSFVIASACVINNYIDRDIDAKMERTKDRSLVSGTVTGKMAIRYAMLLGLIGFLSLAIGTNVVTFLVGFAGYFSYIVLYSVAKRTTIYSTVVGSFPGAMPIVAGYTALAGKIDLEVLILFFILVLWQIPHFYSIAIYRLKDYKSSKLKIWPVKMGILNTKWHILSFILAFSLSVVALFIFKYTGYIYLVLALLSCIVWFFFGVFGFFIQDSKWWARRMFFISLFVLLFVCVGMAI